MKLSDHFTYQEFVISQTAIRKGIDNIPDQSHINNMVDLCNKVLEPIRHFYGIPMTINSGYRCPALNKAIGGSSTSQHTKGQAADIVIPGIDCNIIFEWVVIESQLPYDQIIWEGGHWIHISHKSGGKNNREKNTVANFKNGKAFYRSFSKQEIYHGIEYNLFKSEK